MIPLGAAWEAGGVRAGARCPSLPAELDGRPVAALVMPSEPPMAGFVALSRVRSGSVEGEVEDKKPTMDSHAVMRDVSALICSSRKLLRASADSSVAMPSCRMLCMAENARHRSSAESTTVDPYESTERRMKFTSSFGGACRDCEGGGCHPVRFGRLRPHRIVPSRECQ